VLAHSPNVFGEHDIHAEYVGSKYKLAKLNNVVEAEIRSSMGLVSVDIEKGPK
jgi:hypothetical protein